MQRPSIAWIDPPVATQHPARSVPGAEHGGGPVERVGRFERQRRLDEPQLVDANGEGRTERDGLHVLVVLFRSCKRLVLALCASEQPDGSTRVTLTSADASFWATILCRYTRTL
jgi:hypothetical protein